jgi:SAM-dependent methyltransferase
MTKRDETGRAADLARYYDLDLLDDPGDMAMYLALAAQSDDPILELAAGSGRICVPLAAAGHDVTAVDNDGAMLDRARAAWASAGRRGPVGRGGTLTLIEHDLITLSLGERFGLVIVALNSLLLLDGRGAQARALEVMRSHLAPTGRAVVDVWLPSPDDLALYDGRQVLDWVRTDTETGERVAKTTSACYAPASRTATLTTTFDASGLDASSDELTRRIIREDRISFIAADELLALAAAAGLVPETIAGDYGMTRLSGAGERIVLVARATPA